MERITAGHVIINEHGNYARLYISSAGFAQPSERIQWVTDLHDADVFPDVKVVMARHKGQLKDAQILAATVTRVVTLGTKGAL